MRNSSRLFGRTVFGAAMLATLGFGATQAFGAPGGTAAPERHHQCNATFCNDYCIGMGYAGGSCSGAGGEACLCY